MSGRVLDLRKEGIRESLQSFEGVEHRLEFVQEVNGITFINDSKATNAEAAAFALQAFPDSLWLAGGVAKTADLSSLIPHAKAAKKAYLYGECAEVFAKSLDGIVPVETHETLHDAFWAAQSQAGGEGCARTILLSPAAASFDQFANFVERGDAFKLLVGQTSLAERA